MLRLLANLSITQVLYFKSNSFWSVIGNFGNAVGNDFFIRKGVKQGPSLKSL